MRDPVAVFLLFIICLWCGGCIPPKNLNDQFAKVQVQGHYQHRYVYFEPTFPEQEQELLKRALNTWSEVTGNYIRWTLRPWPEDYWRADLREPEETEDSCSNHVLIFRHHSEDEVIFNIETRLGRTIAGAAYATKRRCGTETILLVVDKLQTPREYKQIAMHELGHILGLNHNKEGQVPDNAKSIMSYRWVRNLDQPTEYDLIWLLKINHLYYH